MIHDQKIRIQRVHKQTFYLIDKTISDDLFIFQISGSTANLYTVTINSSGYDLDKLITCNCPDSTSWAKHAGVKCKHCCFVLLKVLNLDIDSILDDDIYDSNDVFYNKLIIDSCNNLVVKQELINEEYARKYKQMKQIEIKSNSTSASGSGKKQIEITLKNKFSVTKEIEENLDCPICFDELETKNSNQCPTCRNIVHNQCIKKWLSLGNKSCVYCRGDWSDFIPKPKKSKPIHITKYINLDA